MLFDENDAVRLRHPVTVDAGSRWPGLPAEPLAAGAVGTVVAAHGDGEHRVYEVEFVADDGSTTGLLTLTELDIEPIRSRTQG